MGPMANLLVMLDYSIIRNSRSLSATRVSLDRYRYDRQAYGNDKTSIKQYTTTAGAETSYNVPSSSRVLYLFFLAQLEQLHFRMLHGSAAALIKILYFPRIYLWNARAPKWNPQIGRRETQNRMSRERDLTYQVITPLQQSGRWHTG